jgi:pimeloyl-ACP methyl ester carboxylesterase
MSDRHLVISLHGIRTRGVWQKELTAELNRSGFDHAPLDFGFFRALRLLWPPARSRQVRWFLDEYTALSRDHGHAGISVIAHSFGTYLVAQALERFPEVTVARLIFCGSIVRQDYPWTHTICETRQVTEVLNDYGRLDFWAALVGWVVEDAGPSGRRGFSDTARGAVIQREHRDFRHSDYFYTLNYRRNWIPFLQGADPGPLGVAARRPVNWRFRLTLLVVASLVATMLGFALPAVREALAHLRVAPNESAFASSGQYINPYIFECDSYSATACGRVEWVENGFRISSEGASVYLWSNRPLVEISKGGLTTVEFDVLSTANDQEIIFAVSRDRRKWNEGTTDALSFTFPVAGREATVRKGLFERQLHSRRMGGWAPQEWIHVALSLRADGNVRLTIGKQTEVFDLATEDVVDRPYFGFVMWDDFPSNGKPRVGQLTYRNIRVHASGQTWFTMLLKR